MVMPLLDYVPGTEPTPGTYTLEAIFAFILLLPCLLGLFLYVIRALGLYRVARRRGILHPWLAWIPCGRDWLLGSLSDHFYYVAAGKKRYLRVLLPTLAVSTVLVIILDSIRTWALPLTVMNWVYTEPVKALLHTPVFSSALPELKPWLLVLLLIVRLTALYQLYRSSLPSRRLLLLILNILLPFSPAVTIFAVRDYDKGMPRKNPEHKISL